jgi:hypothetical protein
MILIGGIVQENPFFVPPDEFLRELRERPGLKLPNDGSEGGTGGQ